MYNFGVTEGELVIIAVLLMSGIFGQNVWLTPLGDLIPSFVVSNLPKGGWVTSALQANIKMYVVYGLITSFMFMAAMAIFSTFKAAKDKTEAFLQNIPVLMLFVLSKPMIS